MSDSSGYTESQRRAEVYDARGADVALARRPAVIWLHGEALTFEHADTPLAKYGVKS